ncbi:MAG TPA: TIGR03088 family PEP-CTERM/XrtA system glycosyltransferase [Burkholderiales bacterium]|nr:TIGR03088 family PEP-CTERM/XrtA system glycosyltransferase [Burkholderiales bacterium]
MTQPPLIAHVVYRFGMGGLENGLVNLINHMPRAPWRHAVIALTDVSTEFAARLQRTDVEFIALHKGPGHLVPHYPKLWRIFRTLAPAIVHTRNLAPLEAVVPAWAARVPVRVHGEHGWDMQDPHGTKVRYRRVRQLYRPFVTRYVALSQHLQDYLRDQVRIPHDQVTQIYNGVDTDHFTPRASARSRIPGSPFTDPQDWIVGTVGRMETVKDPLNLAKAFVRVLDHHPMARKHMKLVMVGDGALKPDVIAFLEQAGVLDNVWLPGERNDVAAIMQGLDCFVLPSLAEGISNTILEAMATGLPVVATTVGGNTELIESGMTGTLVLRSRSDLMARAMVEYFTNPALARRHGKAARRVVENQFSIHRMVDDYVRMYERAMGHAGVGVAPGSEAARSARMAARSTGGVVN